MAYDITSLKRKLLAVYPFFGSLSATLEYEESEKIRKLASDGKTIYYNPEYLASQSSDDQLFLLAHEMCHVAFNHIKRSRGKNMETWKLATDAVINQLLRRDGFEIIRGGADYPDAIDYDAEEYYELLMADKIQMDLIDGTFRPEAGPGGGQDEDDHSLWEDAVEKEEEDERKKEEDLLEELQDIENLINGDDEDILGEDEEESQDEEDTELGEIPLQDQNEDDEEEEYAIVSEKEAKVGNAIDRDAREVEDIGFGRPILDWRLILRDTINYGVDWSFTNATLEHGIVRPALETVPMPETEIVIDTSWSVDDELLRNFLRECKNILQLSKLKAGCFDTKFYGFQEIKKDKDIDKMVFDGGGGTDFNVAVDAFSMRVDNKIIFTDGEADMPEKPLDAVWLVWGEKEIDPLGGRVIHISPEQMEKLSGKPQVENVGYWDIGKRIANMK